MAVSAHYFGGGTALNGRATGSLPAAGCHAAKRGGTLARDARRPYAAVAHERATRLTYMP